MLTEKDLLKWYDEEYCLEQVKQNGLMLLFINNQINQKIQQNKLKKTDE